MFIPTLEDMQAARARITPHIHVTPVMTSRMLNELSGAELFFKCENFQKGGAFKARGASNAVFGLSKDQAARGVATHSSGNLHGRHAEDRTAGQEGCRHGIRRTRG